MRTRTRVTTREEDSEVNLTPLLDVVFIMLIFFIVTASFVTEYGLDANPPTKGALAPEYEQLLIRITANDEILIERRLVDPRALQATIVRAAAEGKAGVVVQADPRSRNRTLVSVMDASRLAGVYNIAIAQSPGSLPGAMAKTGTL